MSAKKWQSRQEMICISLHGNWTRFLTDLNLERCMCCLRQNSSSCPARPDLVVNVVS